MKKTVTAFLVGAALVATPLTAFAGEGQGVIESIDPATRTIILQDGTTWVAAEEINLDELMSGDAVTVEFEDGTTNLTSVEKVE